MPGMLELDVGSKWLFSCVMLYCNAAMSCFDSATCCVSSILSAAILVHNIFGSHSVSGMIVVFLGDVGGDRRQF